MTTCVTWLFISGIIMCAIAKIVEYAHNLR